jgi:hypothetical protein
VSRWLVSLVIAASVVGSASADHAGLARARGAIDDNKFEEARDHLRATLRSGELGPEDLAQAHLLAGMVELVLGDNASDASFRNAVLLSRRIDLPDGSAPKFRAALAKARAFVDGKGPLRVAIARDADLVVVTIDNDPIGIVTSIAGQGADQKSIVVPAAHKVTLAVASGTVTLRDVWGNTVRELAVPEASAIVRTDPIVDAPVARTEWYRKPIVWGIATGTLAVAGTVAYVLASSAKSDLDDIIDHSASHTFDEAEDARETWRTRVHITDGLFITAGALAVVTLVALVTEPSSVVVTPANGGAQVGYVTRF